MNKFERWIMTRIIRKEVKQSYDHNRRITEMYTMICQAVDDEFTEDNITTRDANLRKCFNKSLI